MTATAASSGNPSLVIDGLTYELRRSPRRTTIGITVDRDGSLVLTAPNDCPEDTIEEAARKKELWVHTKLAEKRLLFRPRPPKEYVTGENFYYLGRTHRLLLVDAPENDTNIPALRLWVVAGPVRAAPRRVPPRRGALHRLVYPQRPTLDTAPRRSLRRQDRGCTRNGKPQGAWLPLGLLRS